MKEICIINFKTNAALYGIGNYLKEYLYCLNNIGCKINMIELGTDDKKNEIYVKEERNIRMIHLPFSKQWTLDSYSKGVCRLLRLYFDDSDNLVFHFQYPENDSLLGEIKKYFPLSKSIFTIHYLNWIMLLKGNLALFEKIIRNRESEKIKKTYGHVLFIYEKEKKFLEKIDQIVCLSNDTLNMIQNQYEIKQNVWLIPNGLRKEYRSLQKKQKEKLRKKYYILPEEKILLFVGRIDRNKGIDSILTCFDEIVKDYSHCRLIVIGSGETDEIIKFCKTSYSKVSFTGRIDKETLYQWYQIADIGLFTSFYEQCSYVGIEMMMHGLPIVASDGYGVKNMFFDGINAKVARIENWNKREKFKKNLKESILELLNSDLSMSTLKKGSKKTYQSKYRIECMQKGYSELLESL
jgi:Glycosyltransferase